MATLTIQPYPIPIVPIPPNKGIMQYAPATYTPPAPPLLPPVLDPLPDVMRQYEQDVHKNKILQKEAERRSKPRGGGLFSSIVGVVEEVGGQIEKGFHDLTTEFDRSIRSTNFENAQRNFYNFFRLPTEPLWREYMCQVVNGQHWVQGNLYISDHYIGFCGEKKLSAGHGQQFQTYRLAFLIPWRNIISIQLGSTMKVSSQNSPPQIQVTNNPNVKHDSLVFYSIDGTIHQFYAFWSHSSTYNVLDHCWRSSWQDFSPAPLPYPLEQMMPPFTPIPRKDRPGLGHTAKHPPLMQTTTTTTTYTPAAYPPSNVHVTSHQSQPIQTQTTYMPVAYPPPNVQGGFQPQQGFPQNASAPPQQPNVMYQQHHQAPQQTNVMYQQQQQQQQHQQQQQQQQQHQQQQQQHQQNQQFNSPNAPPQY